MTFYRTKTPLERFLNKVDKQKNGCWLWTAAVNHCGYGIFFLGARHSLAHRISCILHNVPLLDCQVVHHTCFNRRCVRPSHLKPVSRAELNTINHSRPPKPGMVKVRQRVSSKNQRHRICVWASPEQAKVIIEQEQQRHKKYYCKHCNVLMSHFYIKKRYCSKVCRDHAYVPLRKPRTPCQRCGKAIEFKHGQAPGKKYCGDECYKAGQNEILMFVNPYRRRALLETGGGSEKAAPEASSGLIGVDPQNSTQETEYSTNQVPD